MNFVHDVQFNISFYLVFKYLASLFIPSLKHPFHKHRNPHKSFTEFCKDEPGTIAKCVDSSKSTQNSKSSSVICLILGKI